MNENEFTCESGGEEILLPMFRKMDEHDKLLFKMIEKAIDLHPENLINGKINKRTINKVCAKINSKELLPDVIITCEKNNINSNYGLQHFKSSYCSENTVYILPPLQFLGAHAVQNSEDSEGFGIFNTDCVMAISSSD
jgi:hypothetical protein